MKKILITGASGFIGSSCLNLLKTKDFEVHALSSKIRNNNEGNNIYWHKVNLTSHEEIKHIIEKVKPESLLHLAWDLSKDKYLNSENFTWVKTGIDLLRVFHEAGGKRCVISGTCAEYDWNNSELYSEESTSLIPNSPYGLCKHASYLLTKSYCEQNNLSYSWARIFFAYGPGQNSKSLIPSIIDGFNKDTEIEILHSDLIRDYIFVDDIADALVALVENRLEGSINISSGSPISLKEIVLKIAQYFNKEHLVKFESKPADFDFVVGDNSRLLNDMKWKPKNSLDEGLRKTIESII